MGEGGDVTHGGREGLPRPGLDSEMGAPLEEGWEPRGDIF